ncbi:hypothetical protein [Blastochloris sulfoviridis]|uniref:Uncharacterized protein n=1 Tax=Blastochloris sulfoviridis TaxID=50712 RepID=A0A5M6HRB0_9HYPH|nr:hypothetical protein [Blastochloris sulfoviridis]KAA5598227.1 hypothetical protein F1193_13650 [Blastochloris sulfoviridis]
MLVGAGASHIVQAQVLGRTPDTQTTRTQAPSPGRSGDSKIAEISKQVDELLAAMEAQSKQFPAVLAAIKAKRENIEKADETVTAMIERLKQVTESMDDKSTFRAEMASIEQAISSLIDEARASNDDVIKATLPNLERKLGELRAAEALRGSTIIEARNVIRELEDNKTRLKFLIRAGEVVRAIDMIVANVGEFAKIVEKGKMVTRGLLDASSP